MKKNKITIAILTKNRNEKLARLLASFIRQSKRPEKIVIIDNDTNGGAKKISTYFSKFIPIDYFIEINQGTPFARNRALKEVNTPYIAFVDDDCVVDKNWFLVASNIIEKNIQFSYIIGNNFLLNVNNQLAYAQFIHQREWFFQKLNDNGGTSQFNVDTKNSIFKVSDLKKNNISFDTTMFFGSSSAEDTDLGFALEKHGLEGFFVSDLKVWHEESIHLISVLKKIYSRGVVTYRIVKKWSYSDLWVDTSALTFFGFLKSILRWKHDFLRFKKFDNSMNILHFLYIKLFEISFLRGYRNSLKSFK